MNTYANSWTRSAASPPRSRFSILVRDLAPAAIRANLPGVGRSPLIPDLADFDFDAFLAALRPARALHARHTVGLVDPITGADQTPATRVGDGLPETLEEVIAAEGVPRRAPDLYVERLGAVRLRIESGRMAIGSLDGVGFASGAEPDWTAMRVMDRRGLGL